MGEMQQKVVTIDYSLSVRESIERYLKKHPEERVVTMAVTVTPGSGIGRDIVLITEPVIA